MIIFWKNPERKESAGNTESMAEYMPPCVILSPAD